MFSQFRQAVESLATQTHSPKSSEDASIDDHHTRPSLDAQGLRTSLSSSSQLAESALSNLRKSLASQRSASPGSGRLSASPAPERATRGTHRSTLEDRLRAKLASNVASPEPPPRPSSSSSVVSINAPVSPSVPAAEPPARHWTDPLSPTSTPLPDSPTPIHSPTPLSLNFQQQLSLDTLSLVGETPVHVATEELGSKKSLASDQSSNGLPLDMDTNVQESNSSTGVTPTSVEPDDITPAGTDFECKRESSEDIVSTTEGNLHDDKGPKGASSEEVISTTEDNSHGDSIDGVEEPEHMLEIPDPSIDEEQTGAADKSSSEETHVLMDNPTSEAKAEHTSAFKTGDTGSISNSEGPSVHTDASSSENISDTAHDPTGGAFDDGTQSPAKDNVKLEELGRDILSSANGDAVPSPVQDSHLSTETLDGVSDIRDKPTLVAEDLKQNIIPVTSTTTQSTSGEIDIDALQQRLKLVEQRFTDVSTSFKRLQAEKMAADRVLCELTPLESWQEVDALRDFFQNLNLKNEMAQDEIKRLTGKLTRQDERIEELRDIHRLESKSQSDQIDKLKAEFGENEDLLKESRRHAEEQALKHKSELEQLQTQLDRAKGQAKEEEEKRTKAVALLKTVRQRLVKTEKERDEVSKEAQTIKDQQNIEREKDRAEKLKLQEEIDRVNQERETAVLGLRAQFDKEVAGLKERQEKEISAVAGQLELEAINAKNAYTKELDIKITRISELEAALQALKRDKDELFDQLQMRQAELESSQSHLESLQSQSTEYEFQLREANDRIALLNEELLDIRREQDLKGKGTGPSAEEVTRLLSAAEAKYESRIADLRKRLSAVERERDEGESEWSRKLSDKAKEVESLKNTINASTSNREQEEKLSIKLQDEIVELREEVGVYQKRISDLQLQSEKLADFEYTSKTQIAEQTAKATALQHQIEEGKVRETQLRTHIKTLREELRKVQSSAALLERQRNPGVGFWAQRSESQSDTRSPRSSVSDLPSRDNPSRPDSPATVKSDEEINFEYLRNVIMQFLEHKEMRPHLVRILSTILHFTPQETRRIIAKV